MQKRWWDYFAIPKCIHLCSHITLSSSSNVNIVEWLVSMPAVRLFVGFALAILFGLACRGLQLIGVLLMYFFKKFRIKDLGLRLGCMFKFRFKVYY